MTELGAHLRIGGDATWIVIRGAGYQSRAKFSKHR